MKFIKKSFVLATLFSFSLGGSAWGQSNTQATVVSGKTDLTSSTSYSPATAPSATVDADFIGTYSPTAFTIGSSISLGSINDADTTQSLSITGTAVDTLTLNGGDSYSGAGSTSDMIFLAGGGTTSLTFAGTSSSKLLTIAMNGSGNFEVGSGGTLTFGAYAIVSGSGDTLSATGAGNVVFDSAYAVTLGTLDVNSGTVTVEGNGTDTIGTVNVAGGTLTETSAGNLTVSGALNITSGTATLAATNTITGGTTLSAGAFLNVNAASSLGGKTSTLTINGGTIDNTSAGTVTATNNVIINSDFTFTGTQNLTFSGAAAEVLGGSGTTRTITVNANTLSIKDDISNGATVNSITKTGAGTLTLTGTNSFTGGVDIKNGTVILSENSTGTGYAAGTGTITLGDAAGGSVTLESTVSTTPNTINLVAPGSGTLTIGNLTTGGTGIFTSNLVLPNYNLTIAATSVGSIELQGNITGTGNLTFLNTSTAGSPQITLNGNTTSINNTGTITNTGTATGGVTRITEGIGPLVTGVIQNSSGTLDLDNNNSTYANGITVLQGTLEIEIAGSAGTGAITLGSSSGGSATVLATNGSFSNALILGNGAVGPLTLNLQNTTKNSSSFSGPISLSGDNLTIVGTTTNTGTGSGSLSGATYSVTGGITGTGNLTINNNASTIANNTNPLLGPLVFSGASVNNTGSITNTGTSTGSVTISAVIGTNVTGVIQNSSTSNLVLSGANTYTSGTTVMAGTLQAGSSTAFGNNASLTVTGGTVDLNGNNVSVGNLDSGGVSGGTITDSVATPSTLTIGADGGPDGGNYGGVIADGNGQVALTMTGAGTITLSGVNTYSGPTTIAGGKLRVTGSLGAGSAVTVGNGTSAAAVLSGTGTINGSVTTFTNGSDIAYLAPGVNTATAGTSRTDFGGVGTLNIGGNGLTLGAGTNLDFDLSNSVSGSNDLINVAGGTVSFGSGTGALVLNVDETNGTLSTSSPYVLINGGTHTNFVAADMSANIVGGGTLYTAVFSDTGSELEVTFSPAGAPTNGQYTLFATPASVNVHVNDSTTVTTTIKNTGTIPQDTLNYSGLGTGNSANLGTLGSLSGTTSGTGLAQGSTSSGVTQTYTAGSTAGNDTITPAVTSVTNTTASGTPVGTISTATINVYSGQSTWTGAGDGSSWGTLTSGFGANWGANQGSPGLDPNFTSTDTATFGSAAPTATINLNGASPSLAAITFDNTSVATNYTLTNAGGGNFFLNGGGSPASITVNAGNFSGAVDTISAPITLTTSANLAVAAGQQLNLSGVISGPGTGLTSTGAGTIVLSASNTFTGGLTVKNGTVDLAAAKAAAGLTSVAIALGDTSGSNNASLLAEGVGTTITVANPITVVGGSSGNTLTFGGGSATNTNTFSGAITLDNNVTAVEPGPTGLLQVTGGISSGGGAQTVTFAGPGSISVFTGAITNGSGTVGVDVTGGTVNFGSKINNTYSGGTVISGGTLYANGDNSGADTATGTGSVTVQSGGTLSGGSSGANGPGIIQPGGANLVTVQAGGNLAPGSVQTNGGAANGNLNLDTTLITTGHTILSTTSSNATTPALTFALGTGSTTNGNGENTTGSQLVITGGVANTINFNNNTVIAINDLTNGNLTLNEDYVLIQGDNTTYTGLTTGASDGSLGLQITGGLSLLPANTVGNSFSQEYPTSMLFLNGDNIDVEVVPEPSTWGALMLGGLALFVVYQRRQKLLR